MPPRPICCMTIHSFSEIRASAGSRTRRTTADTEALAFLRSQVGRDEAERVVQPLAVAHDDRAALDGYRQPLVGIQGERIRARETDIARRQVGVERADRAVPPVDMEPVRLVTAEKSGILHDAATSRPSRENRIQRAAGVSNPDPRVAAKR
jgi:hypothetical protein